MTKTIALFLAFVGVVYGANWALETWGLVEIPLIRWEAPAGVLFAGLAFGIRDALHEAGGAAWRRWVIGAIAAGAALSYWVSDGVTILGGQVSIAVASGLAFAVSELVDLAIYAPMRERHWKWAVISSNFVGAIVDSALFLWLAFGAIEAMGGQLVGKWAMVAPAMLLVGWVRSQQPICWACDGATDEEVHTCR